MTTTAHVAHWDVTRYGLTDPMTPRLFRVTKSRRETADTFTIELEPEDGRPFDFLPGQFNMLYAFGIGESAISIAGDATDTTRLVHTIRVVGKVSEALAEARPGTVIGVRGPFGRPWPMEKLKGRDILFVAGGVGLAPLRSAILHTITNRRDFGRVMILYGARTPADLLYEDELHDWRGSFSLTVKVTVDRAGTDWYGRVGVVTKLIEAAEFDASAASALMCGPEVMMRFSVETLLASGLPENRIFVSMERNMKCATGFCGHCQLGGVFICRHGPVFRHDEIAEFNRIREL